MANRREKVKIVTDFIFLGSKIPTDSNCSHENKRHLLLGRKVMTNLDSTLKSRDITLPTKEHIVKAMAFPVVTYRCKRWTIKKAEHQRTDPLQLWCCWRCFSVLWTARRSNQSIQKEINFEYSSEGLMLKLKLKLQYFGHLMWRLTHWKRPWCWERLRAGGKGANPEWDSWIASSIQWIWVLPSSRREWKAEAWHATVHGVTKSQTWLSN